MAKATVYAGQKRRRRVDEVRVRRWLRRVKPRARKSANGSSACGNTTRVVTLSVTMRTRVVRLVKKAMARSD